MKKWHKISIKLPVPVEHWPLDQILADYQQQQLASSELQLWINKFQLLILFLFITQTTVATTTAATLLFLKSNCLRKALLRTHFKFSQFEISSGVNWNEWHCDSPRNFTVIDDAWSGDSFTNSMGWVTSWTFVNFNEIQTNSFFNLKGEKINQKSIAPQSEITVPCGSQVTIDINVSNNQATTMHNLILSVQFYQDFQNGMQNYRLETRTCSSGINQ